MKKYMDKVICDNCSNYKVSPGGCVESCSENLSCPFYLTEGYFEERQNGDKSNCKAFKPLTNVFSESSII